MMSLAAPERSAITHALGPAFVDPHAMNASQRARGPSARHRPDGLRLAQAAGIVGMLFAAVSVYWGLGGMWLLDTVSATFAEHARAGDAGLYVAVWSAVALKTIAVVLPLLALRAAASARWARSVWGLAWLGAACLIVYGLTQTVGSLLALAGVIHSDASDRVLTWHACLWDAWFLVWGLLVAAALLRGRRWRSATARG